MREVRPYDEFDALPEKLRRWLMTALEDWPAIECSQLISREVERGASKDIAVDIVIRKLEMEEELRLYMQSIMIPNGSPHINAVATILRA